MGGCLSFGNAGGRGVRYGAGGCWGLWCVVAALSDAHVHGRQPASWRCANRWVGGVPTGGLAMRKLAGWRC